MADALTESIGPVGHEDENYLDFELGDGHIQSLSDMAVVDGGVSNEASGHDFDVQIDVLSDGGDHNSNEEHVVTNGDASHGELGVPKDNVTVSEIDYDEENDDKPPQAATHLTASHDQTQEENHAGSADNVDEITYDDADVGVSKATYIAVDADDALQPALDPEVAQHEFDAHDQVHHPKTSGLSEDGSDPNLEAQNEDHDESLNDLSAVDNLDAEHQALVDQSNDDFAAEEGDNMDDGKPLHNVIATYRGREYELFASQSNSDPDTYFFASTDEMDFPLWELFEGIRGVLRDEVQPADELIISIEDLDLEIRSSSDENFLSETTMRDLLNLYLQLQENDGVTDEPNLFIQLIARPSCEERYRLLSEAAGAGQGLSEFYNSPEQSEMASEHYSDGESVGGSASPAEQADREEEDEEMGEMEAVGVVEQGFFIDNTNNILDGHDNEDQNGLYQGDYEGDNLSTRESEHDQQKLLDEEAVEEQHDEGYIVPDNYTGETQADDEQGNDTEQNATAESAYHENDANEDSNNDEVSITSAVEQAGAEAASRTGESEIDEGLEDLTVGVQSGVTASDPFATGKEPLSVHPVMQRDFTNEVSGYGPDDESEGSFWRELDPPRPLNTSRPVSGSHEEHDLIDYSEDDEPMTSGRTSPGFSVPEGLISSTLAHEDLIDYSDDEEMCGDYEDSGDYESDEDLSDFLEEDDESFAPSSTSYIRAIAGHSSRGAPSSDGQSAASEPATDSVLFGPPTLSTPERCALEFPLLFQSRHSRLHLISQCSSATSANLPDPQAQHDLNDQPDTVSASETGSIGQHRADDVPNGDALDEGGEVDYFITTEDATNDGAPSDHDQADSSNSTSITATVHGDEDEIDYDEDDDEPVTQHIDSEGNAVQGASNELDEIDWMNDGDEASSSHGQDKTSQMSPGSSAKRLRDVGDGAGVNDESDTPAKRQKL